MIHGMYLQDCVYDIKVLVPLYTNSSFIFWEEQILTNNSQITEFVGQDNLKVTATFYDLIAQHSARG